MKNNKGFTLTEVMIAMVIIGIIALVLIVRSVSTKDKPKQENTDTTAKVTINVAGNGRYA